ncbi:MAG: 30S ribosomal protein S20 [Herpetosiphon sp.]
MANTKSALKHVRSDERKRVRNLKVRSRVKTVIKKAREELTPEAIRAACAQLDKAASKGVIHKGNAARRKSRLLHHYNKQQTASQTA